MDRRFFTWLMLTTALFFLWMSFRQPPPADPRANQPPAAPNADPLLRENAPPEAGVPGDRQAEIGAGDDPLDLDSEQLAAARPDNPSQLVLLGSLEPDSQYNLLVAINSRGGGVERTELVGQTKPGRFRYRALEHDGGYLGYLGLTETTSGLRVRCVPTGSPAAMARIDGGAGNPPGMQPGDVITTLNALPTPTLADWRTVLDDVKPGREVQWTAVRGQGDAAETLTFTANAIEMPLDVVRINELKSESVDGNLDRLSLLTTLGSINTTEIPVGKYVLPALADTLLVDWAVEELNVPGGQGVTMRLPLDSFLKGTGRPEKLDLVKHYRLLPAGEQSDGYILDLETVIENRNEEEVRVSFRQEGLSGLTLEGWWYSVKISPYMFAGAGQRDVIYNSQLESHKIATTRSILDRAKETPQQPDIKLFSEGEPIEARTLSYLGLDAQYFNASILPHPEAPMALTDLRQAAATAIAIPADILKSQAQATNVSFWLDTSERALAAGDSFSQRYQVFLGPKDTEILESHGLGRAIEYGWFPWIAKPLGWILHFFYAIVRNYALAIVLLTVMVRAAMFPLGRKAAMNAQRMQELQPELKRINELHKDDMQKRAKAMQDLYAEHNFKPLAGCLPMFIQLPIFIGLYRCLSVDISLRQQPLIPGLDWCSNLAGPDQLFNWSTWMPEFIAGRGTGWLGPYFNLLPMVTVALFLVQQQMLMPKATDEQTRMTQNMMKFMTIFMGVLFFKVPAGLCIYFVTSSIWSLVERKLVKRLTPATPNRAAAVGKEAANGKSGSKGDSGASGSNARKNRRTPEPPPAAPGKFQELMKMLEKPAVKSSTQRGSSKTGSSKPSSNKGPRPSRKGKKQR